MMLTHSLAVNRLFFLACEVSLSLSDSLQRAGAIHTIPSRYERCYNINSQHVKSQSETHIFTVWILSFSGFDT